MNVKTPISVRKVSLLALQSELRARIVSIKHDIASHESSDWEEQATEREDDEVQEAQATAAQHDLRQIEAALVRIEIVTYGICVKCGTDIEEARLDLLPYTPFCSACAA